MTVLLVLLLICTFVGVDCAIQFGGRWAKTRRLAEPAAEAAAAGACNLPGGSFLSEGHAWVRIEPAGEVRVGIDDFALMAAGPVSRVSMPEPGQDFHRGEPLFSLRVGDHELHFRAPVSGRVLEDNDELRHDAGSITESPYDQGWVCRIEPSDLASELSTMRIGQPAVSWYDEEIKRLEHLRASQEIESWDLESAFLLTAR
jgi:glycine cleavage system H protein